MLESESDSPQIRDLFWKPRRVAGAGDEVADKREARVGTEEKSETLTEGVEGPPGPGSGSEKSRGHDEEAQQAEPLAVVLVNSIYHLLFLPDFTIEDPNIAFKEEDLITHRFKSSLMWAPGYFIFHLENKNTIV